MRNVRRTRRARGARTWCIRHTNIPSPYRNFKRPADGAASSSALSIFPTQQGSWCRRTRTVPGRTACWIARGRWHAAATSRSGSHTSSIRSSLVTLPSTLPPATSLRSLHFSTLESHDHSRFVNQFGTVNLRDLLGERYGNRDHAYDAALRDRAVHREGYSDAVARPGVRRELGRSRRRAGAQPLRASTALEFFYDEVGKALVRLHRILGTLRRTRRALRSRGFYYYYYDQAHLQRGVIAYRRKAEVDGASAAEDLLVLLNFSESETEVWLPFPTAGTWVERIDGTRPAIHVTDGQWAAAVVPSNYGSIYERT